MMDREAFSAIITRLIATPILERKNRIDKVNLMLMEFIEAYGEVPDGHHLQRLADYLLSEELKDTDRMKSRNEAYPFLSDRQFERRWKQEVPLEVAGEYGADGRNNRMPIRRKRTMRELLWMDANALMRNAERMASYRTEIAPGPVVQIKLDESGVELSPAFIQCTEITYTCIPEYYRQ